MSREFVDARMAIGVTRSPLGIVRRHAHGEHRYTAEEFEPDPHELRERFAFLDG